jgi:hypothetical protein
MPFEIAGNDQGEALAQALYAAGPARQRGPDQRRALNQ